MGNSYGKILRGNIMGLSYGDFLWGFQMDWAGLGRLDRAGLCWAGQGLPGLAWDVMGFQSRVENPHKISP